MKCIFMLNQQRDIPLALILQKSCPFDFKIGINLFNYIDEYQWPKRKSMQCCLNQNDLNFIIKSFNKLDCLVFIKNYKDWKNTVKKFDVCLSRGVDFFIFKPIIKNNIAFSFNRCYFNRLLDIFPYYKDKLKVFMFSNKWIDEKIGNFMMDDHFQNSIKSYVNNFDFFNPYSELYSYFEKEGKEKIKLKYNIKSDKILFLSFRMAQKNFSLYPNSDAFMKNVKDNLKYFKSQGYFIISRRRLGIHDLNYYKVVNAPDVLRYNEIEHMVDLELSDIGNFPGQIWESLFISDFMFLVDISGICYVESALMKCPVFMPYSNDWLNTKFKNINPAIKDMVNKKLIFNKFNNDNIKFFKENIDNFLNDWYQNDLDYFWKGMI